MHEQRVWSERGPGSTVGGGGGQEDRSGAVSPRKEQGRASTENWRSRTSAEGDDADRWRGSVAPRADKWGQLVCVCFCGVLSNLVDQSINLWGKCNESGLRINVCWKSSMVVSIVCLCEQIE